MSQLGGSHSGGQPPDQEHPAHDDPLALRYFFERFYRTMSSKPPAASEHGSPPLPPTPPPSPAIPIEPLEILPPQDCPGERLVPLFFRSWDNFDNGQPDAIAALHAYFSEQTAEWPPEEQLVQLRRVVTSDSRSCCADTIAVQMFFHYAIEVHLTQIISALNVPHAAGQLNAVAGTSIRFCPELTTVTAAVQPFGEPRQAREKRTLWLRPNQTCVYRTGGSELQTMIPICVNEYHSPDAITLQHLQDGLMSLSQHRQAFTTAQFNKLNPVDGVEYWTLAEKKTLSAVTHTYSVMVKAGLSFGLVTTGEAIVFLSLDWNNPGTLFFKLMDPSTFSQPTNAGFLPSNSAAAAQCLSFYMLALKEATREELEVTATKTRAWHSPYPFTRVCEPLLDEIGRERSSPFVFNPHRFASLFPPHPPRVRSSSVNVLRREPPVAISTLPIEHTPVYISRSSPSPNLLSLSPTLAIRSGMAVPAGHSKFQSTRFHALYLPVPIPSPSSYRIVENHAGIDPRANSSEDWPRLNQHFLPPISYCAAQIDTESFNKLPPILSDWKEQPVPRIPDPQVIQSAPSLPPSGTSIGTTPSRGSMPGMSQQLPHHSLPQANNTTVGWDEEAPPRQGIAFQLGQEIPGESPNVGGQPSQSQSQQATRAHTVSPQNGGRSGYNKTHTIDAKGQLGRQHRDKNGRKNKDGGPQRHKLPFVNSSPKSTERAREKITPDPPLLRYCTHLCLLGLMEGEKVDFQCPNVMKHLGADEMSDHRDLGHKLSYTEFLEIVGENIHHGADNDAELMHAGDHDSIFKMRLSGYDYTFVYKRFESSHRATVDHEVAMYDQLKEIQGQHVPLFLGQICIRRFVKKECQPRLIRYTLMSSAGVPLSVGFNDYINKSFLREKAEDAIKALHSHGVLYTPTIESMSFNKSQQSVVVTGLGRSRLIDSGSYQPSYEENGLGQTSIANNGTPRHGPGPKKRRRSSPSADGQEMTISKMTHLFSKGLTNPILRDVYEVRKIFNALESEIENS